MSTGCKYTDCLTYRYLTYKGKIECHHSNNVTFRKSVSKRALVIKRYGDICDSTRPVHIAELKYAPELPKNADSVAMVQLRLPFAVDEDSLYLYTMSEAVYHVQARIDGNSIWISRRGKVSGNRTVEVAHPTLYVNREQWQSRARRLWR